VAYRIEGLVMSDGTVYVDFNRLREWARPCRASGSHLVIRGRNALRSVRFGILLRLRGTMPARGRAPRGKRVVYA
jgi:hypothetical protein